MDEDALSLAVRCLLKQEAHLTDEVSPSLDRDTKMLFRAVFLECSAGVVESECLYVPKIILPGWKRKISC